MHKHVRIQKSNLISTSRKRGKKTNSQFPPTGIERPEQIKAKLSLKSYKTAACPPLACPSQLTVPVTKASVPRAFLHACVHAWLRWWWVENCAVARTSPPLEIHPGVTRLFVSTIKKKKEKKKGGTHVVGTIIRKVCFLSALVSPIGIRASPQRTWNYARIRGAQLPLPALRNRSLSASLFVPFSLFLRPISVWRWKSFFSLLGKVIRWIRFFPIEIDVK